jgi:glycosyltransferase involved in cell wall biosynthesis
LAQAIESALMQKTNFSFEMIIGEDGSTDNTRKVLEKYAALYPDIVKPIYHANNVGAYENMRQCLAACKGEYIAGLEGDDYWTDPYKLQKQVDFLDNNPAYYLCLHRVLRVHQDSQETKVSDEVPREDMYFNDFVANTTFQTVSFVFRRSLLPGDTKWITPGWHTDWALLLFAAERGPIRYMRDLMAVYRIHGGGVFSTVSTDEKTQRILDMLYIWLKHYKGTRFEKPFYLRMVMERMNLATYFLEIGQQSKVAEQIKQSLLILPKVELSALPLAAKRVLGASVRLAARLAGAKNKQTISDKGV